MSFWPEDDQTRDDGHDQPDEHHLLVGLGDDDWRPDPNFLAQFRQPVTEEQLDEMARALEQAIAEVFGEPDADR